MSEPPTGGLPARLVEFIGSLREHGLQIGPGESIDAAAAVEVLGLADRDRLRHGLAAALLRRAGQQEVFDGLFDLFFPTTVGTPPPRPRPEADAGQDERRSARPDRDELREQLAVALGADDREQLARLAASVLTALGGRGEGGGAGAGWSAELALDRLQPQTLIAGVEAERNARAGREPDFTDRLLRDEIRAQVEAFRELVRAEARRRGAELRGRQRVARYGIPRTVDQVDFLYANRQQLAELRRTVQPLSRRLATRLARRRRRRRRGELDLRRTFRRSLSTGGVPVRPVYRKPRPGRPELVLFCDVSSSVAGFANFTMLLVQALHEQFSRVRAFAFIDATDEITDLVAQSVAGAGTDPIGLARQIVGRAGVSRWGGHTDYGSALADLVIAHPDAIGPRSSVLILGDARTNGGDPNLPALRTVVDNARHVYWLNPEPRESWNTGDSVANIYQRYVEMFECRNAAQLTAVISRLLPV